MRPNFSFSLLHTRPVKENSKSVSKHFTVRPVKENSRNASKFYTVRPVKENSRKASKFFSFTSTP